MKKKLISEIAFFALATLTSSCASTHPGQMGKTIAGDDHGEMQVSGKKEEDYSDDYYSFITFTIENKSDEILRIKSAEIEFDAQAAPTANILVGDDLLSWAKAEQEQLDKAKENKRIGQLALILGGAILGGIGHANHSDVTSAIGAGALLGGAAWAVSDSIDTGKANAQNPQRVPSEHIYAPFSVPMGKFLRKWAVIQHPKGAKISRVNLKLQTVTGIEATYEILL